MKKVSRLLPAFAVMAQGGAKNSISILPGGQWHDLGNLSAAGVVSGLIRLALVVVALVFFAMLIWGGIRWMMSKGDKTEVENARNQISNALIGLAIVFVAWALIKLIQAVFGIDILELTIPSLQS